MQLQSWNVNIQIHIDNKCIPQILSKCAKVNGTESHWQSVNNGLTGGLVPSDIKSVSQRVVTKLYDVMRR